MKNKLVNGHVQNGKFVMKSIGDQPIDGIYTAHGLRSLARLIVDNEPLNLILDQDKTLYIPIEANRQLRDELFLIANEIDK